MAEDKTYVLTVGEVLFTRKMGHRAKGGPRRFLFTPTNILSHLSYEDYAMTRLSPSDAREIMEGLASHGILERDGEGYQMTEHGYDVYLEIMAGVDHHSVARKMRRKVAENARQRRQQDKQ